MIEKGFIIALLVNQCLTGEDIFNCPFPEDAPKCDCRADIGLLTCIGTAAEPIELPKLTDTERLPFNEVILENIKKPSHGEFFKKIKSEKIKIKTMENELLLNIEETEVKQLILEDITSFKLNEFLKKPFPLLTHLTIIKGSTKISEEIENFDKLPKLKFIDLKEHEIKGLKENCFQNLHSVEKIDLSSNSITFDSKTNGLDFTSTDVTIDLSHNKIDESRLNKSFEFKSSQGGFIAVDLSNNPITHLKDIIFQKYCKKSSISINLNNNQISCAFPQIKWLFDCERGLSVFQNVYCSEYGKYFAQISPDDFIDREKPVGDLEINILSVNLTEDGLVNVAVCVQDPRDQLPQCKLCVKPKDEKQENVKIHDLNKKCDIENRKYREDSVITIGIANERHSNLDVGNVEGFTSILLYEDIMKGQMNDKEYKVESTDKNPGWTAVVKIKWTEKTS